MNLIVNTERQHTWKSTEVNFSQVHITYWNVVLVQSCSSLSSHLRHLPFFLSYRFSSPCLAVGQRFLICSIYIRWGAYLSIQLLFYKKMLHSTHKIFSSHFRMKTTLPLLVLLSVHILFFLHYIFFSSTVLSLSLYPLSLLIILLYLLLLSTLPQINPSPPPSFHLSHALSYSEAVSLLWLVSHYKSTWVQVALR